MAIDPRALREEYRACAGNRAYCSQHIISQTPPPPSRPQRASTIGKIGYNSRRYSGGNGEEDRDVISKGLWEGLDEKIRGLLDRIPCGTLEKGRACEAYVSIQKFVRRRADLLPTDKKSLQMLRGAWDTIKKGVYDGSPPHSIHFRQEPITGELEVITRVGYLGGGAVKKIHELLFVTKDCGAQIVAIFRPRAKQTSQRDQAISRQVITQGDNLPKILFGVSRLEIAPSFDQAMEKEIALLEELHANSVPYIPKIKIKELREKAHYMTDSSTCDLFTYLKKLFTEPIDASYYAKAHHFAICLLETISAMHERCKRVHLDLKPENILVSTASSPPKILLIDFSSSLVINERCERLTGTSGYLPPELLEWHNYTATTKTDMWTCGLILFLLMRFYNPFSEIQKGPDTISEWGKSSMGMIEAVQKNLRNQGGEENELVARLLDKNPQNRPDAIETLSTLRRLYNMPAMLQESHVSDHAEDPGRGGQDNE